MKFCWGHNKINIQASRVTDLFIMR